MENTAELAFFRELLAGLHIPSTVLREPEKRIPPEIDLGLRFRLFGEENYALLLANSMSQAEPNTIYRFFDEYDCKYIFFRLPGVGEPVYFFAGPYLLELPSKPWLEERVRRLGLAPEQQNEIALYYASLPILEDEGLLLAMVNTLARRLWGREDGYRLEYVEYMIPDRCRPIPNSSLGRGLGAPRLDLAALEQNYADEKTLMDAVSRGKLHLVTTAATALNAGASPRLTDSLRDRKNNLVILKTLLRKAAELGGVHPLHIHRLSSRYAGEIEAVRTVKQSLRLQEEMIRSYCLLVKRHSLHRYSYYVGQAITLVQYDLTADLGLSAIAKRLNVNASYLSDLFHREYGCTLTQFVSRERVNQAIHLLQTTQRPVQEIAAACGVAEPAYFIRLFKKQTGMTPNQYRQNMAKASGRR